MGQTLHKGQTYNNNKQGATLQHRATIQIKQGASHGAVLLWEATKRRVSNKVDKLCNFHQLLVHFVGKVLVTIKFIILLLSYEGGFLDQKSPFFQEEFPSLVSGGEEKSPQQKKEEEKEPQYGPGPSLRPQSKFKAIRDFVKTRFYHQSLRDNQVC